jgi:hypothetical protein
LPKFSKNTETNIAPIVSHTMANPIRAPGCGTQSEKFCRGSIALAVVIVFSPHDVKAFSLEANGYSAFSRATLLTNF